MIWCEISVQISGKVSNDNAQKFKDDDGNNKTHLGAVDTDTFTGLTYAYTEGRTQITGTLRPTGLHNVCSTGWHIKRTITCNHFDNETLAKSVTNHDDTSDDWMLDLDPDSGGSAGKIYDLDPPGCSANLSGTTINHTSEAYNNFTQWIEWDYNTTSTRCSDNAVWSYEARADVDEAVGNKRVPLNRLSLKHMTIPANAHYAAR